MQNPLRLPDGGPRYDETPVEIQPYYQCCEVAEPYNALTAAAFIALAVFWFFRLRSRKVQSLFLNASLIILFVGGIGGTLYHGTRASKIFFLLDVVPIFLLCLLLTSWLWIRLKWPMWLIFAFVAGCLGVQAIASSILPINDAINVSYALLGVFVLVPIGLSLRVHQGPGGKTVFVGLASFAVALMFRMLDQGEQNGPLPMGTHWLWHLFGCITCGALIHYVSLMIANRTDQGGAG